MGTVTRLTVFRFSSVLCEENRFKHVKKFTNEIDNIALRATKCGQFQQRFLFFGMLTVNLEEAVVE